MDRLSLKAEERTVLGKKVKNLRKEGMLPGHVFGKGLETEHISVNEKIFLKTFAEAGETGLIDLKISKLTDSSVSKLAANAVEKEKIRPVLIRDIQVDPVTDKPLHIDFYQVNLKEKVTVPVPIILTGEEPESVHMGEAVMLQTLNEVQVEAFPTDLIENIEVDITVLKNIDDTVTVGQLKLDREKLTILAEEDEVVVKLAPAVTEEMKALLEEQETEAAAAQEEAVAEEGAEGEKTKEGEGTEGETTDGEATGEGGKETKTESVEDKKEE